MEKKYNNGEITIVWKPDLCIHSTNCWHGLPSVFRPVLHPWIEPHGADTARIIKQIDACPSGALSYYFNN
ncbi:MAG: (4Fe-4S)-binding protein [Prevotellaceae bacterium]|nr:(4Fe-4S)-binding protein [Prevotellaceae bacterium]